MISSEAREAINLRWPAFACRPSPQKRLKVNSFNSSISHNGPERKDENRYHPPRSVSGERFACGSSANAAPNAIGSGLTASDYAALETRWIDCDLAVAAGLRRVDSLTGGDVVGRKCGNYAGI